MANVLDPAGSLFGSIHEDIHYRLRIADVDEGALRVSSFQATEGLSELFSYSVVVASDPALSLRTALGKEAAFAIEREGKLERVVEGIITEVRPDGAYVGKRQVRTVLLLEPRLAALRHSHGFRIFQNVTVKQIVEELVKPERIECEWRMRPQPRTREYCMQFNENKLQFLRRILADEGIHFHLDRKDDKPLLVFVNAPAGYEKMAGVTTLRFRDGAGAVTDEHVSAIALDERLRTGSWEHQDYDFTKPQFRLTARAEVKDSAPPGVSARHEWHDYPGDFVDAAETGTANARMRLEQLRSDATTLRGKSTCIRFLPGRQFTLQGHDDKVFNRDLLVTFVTLQGSAPSAFLEISGGARGARASSLNVTFDAVPAEVPLRPPFQPKPAVRLQSARVVGPKEGDPYVDEFGRIKVQFFWDRDGKLDEHSSCWVRMMSPAAHAAEGFWQPHKVGSEVLVEFLDGDVDRPVVIGAVFNREQRQPYKLPDDVAKSSWITKSVPGNKGVNEITHDSKAGHEKIYVHAERDMVEVIKHNHTETTGATQTTSVGASQHISVGSARTVNVGATETIDIAKDRKETVGEKEDVTVKKGRAHTINEGGDSLHVILGDRKVDIDAGSHVTNVKATTKLETEDIETHARKTIAVTGDQKVIVTQGATTATLEGGNVDLEVAGKTTIHHKGTTVLIDDAGKVTVTAEPALEINCQGAQVTMGGGKVAIQAPQEITFAVGQSGVKISAEGVELSGPKVKSTALTGMNEISGLVVKLN